jgi:diadenosine tetraphosphate (Ap4A) HIT family hydrolase
MGEFRPFDMTAYVQQIQEGPCFICSILEGRDETHHVIYWDDVGIAFLSKFPTLYGYVLVAPVVHREQVTGDFTLDEYVALQKLIYRVGEAVRRVVATERLYILSLGSQQGNSHVHWHIAPLPPGVPFEQQQLAALSVGPHGYLYLNEEQRGDLARRLAEQMAASG